MRKQVWLAVLALVLGTTALRAQQFGSTTTATSSGQTFTPMQVGPYSGSSGVSRLNQGVKNFFNWLPSLNPLAPNSSSAMPTSTFPTAAQMPGMSYLQAFGYQVGQPAQ